MHHPELLLLSALRALVQVALLFLIGQGILALLAGKRRQSNPVYQLFVIVTRPALRLVRRLTPPQILDKHLPYVAFFLLFWLLVALTYLKQDYCTAHLLQCF